MTPILSQRCECTWTFHQGNPCVRAPMDTSPVVSSPALCAPCLFACEGERDDEIDSKDWRGL